MITLPSKAVLHRVVPQKKFYGKAHLSTALKAKAAEQIEQIIWLARLAPDTINVAPGKAVEEIQVFHLMLRAPEPDPSVLKLIEEAIPYRIVFILEYQGKKRLLMYYKEDKAKGGIKVRRAFSSDWLAPDVPILSIQGLDMDAVYESFIRQLAGDVLIKGVPLAEALDAIELQERLQNQIASLERKLANEEQPRRKHDYFVEIQTKKSELQTLRTKYHE